jgi:signal transduction histidine kinase
MRKTGLILLIISLTVIIFIYIMVSLANWNIERMYKSSSENTFYLISLMIDHYLRDGRTLEDIQVAGIRQIFKENERASPATYQELVARYPEGFWIFKHDSVISRLYKLSGEDEILDLYRRDLRGNDAHTVVIIDGQPYYLVNTVTNVHEILVIDAARGPLLMRINELLDSLILASNLLYYAVLDSNNSPVIFSTLYENFLPLRGEGVHKIKTLDGNVFHIETDLADRKFIGGFSMRLLERITSANNLFFLFAAIVFILLELAFFFTLARFQKFKAAKERQVGALREISALSTGFAHEFRNSLHTLSLLARDLCGENKRILTEEIGRMNTVMGSLKLVGMTSPRKENILLRDAVAEAISLSNNMLLSDAPDIVNGVDPEVVVLGQRTLLVTVFSNLIRNSIEARANNVTVSTSRQGNEIEITVIDDGGGIDRDILERIFEPFFSKKEHSGLGLYLVKRIIDLHDGTITAECTDKTVFRITLKVV